MSTIRQPALAVLGVLAALAVALAASEAWGGASARALVCIDRTPPLLSVSVTPPSLSPPDLSLRTATATIKVKDDCDPSPAISLLGISSSGPDIVNPPAWGPDVQGASFGTDDRSFLLRAEMDGDATTRTYTIFYRARDAAGRHTVSQNIVVVSAVGRGG